MIEKEEVQFINIKDLSLEKLLEIEIKSVTNLLVDKRYKFLRPLIEKLSGKYGKRYTNAISFILTQASLTVSKGSSFSKMSLNRNHYVKAKGDKLIKCGLDLVVNTLKMMQKDKLLTVYKGEYYQIQNFPVKTKGVMGGVTTVVEFKRNLIEHLESCHLLKYLHFKRKPLNIIRCPVSKTIIYEGNDDEFVEMWNKVLKGNVSIGDVNFDVNYQKIEHIYESVVFGGRYYCGGFQTIKSHYRSFIRLSDKSTIELDFESCQPALLASLVGLKIPEGHKVYEAYDGIDYDRKLLRDLFKRSFLAVLYSANKNQAIHSVKDKVLHDKDLRDELKLNTILKCKVFSEDVINRLVNHNNFMYHLFFDKNGWKGLQTKDSQICRYVVRHFVAKGIPILSYHDSFRVAEEYKSELKTVMKDAWRATTGNEFNCVIKE